MPAVLVEEHTLRYTWGAYVFRRFWKQLLTSRPEAAFYFAVGNSIVLALSETALYWRCQRQHRTAAAGGSFVLQHLFQTGDLGLGVGLLFSFQGDDLLRSVGYEAFVTEFLLYPL